MTARRVHLLTLALCVAAAGAQADTRQDCLSLSGDAAIAACTQAIQDNPNDAGVHNARALAYAQKRDAWAAFADFNRAIDLDPNSPLFRYQRGRVFMMGLDFRRAIVDFNKAIELDPSEPSYYNLRGIAHREIRDVESAIADFTKAIEVAPAFPGAYFNRGLLYVNIGDAKGRLGYDIPTNDLMSFLAHRDITFYDRAIADFSKAIELRPDFVQAYRMRGEVKRVIGDTDGGAADIAKAKELEAVKN